MAAPIAPTPGDALALPLEGTRLVEASAGTGKTFTIATLYLRLILERGLGVDEIVVATFTRAAAAELSERLRGRLQLACDLLGNTDTSDATDPESGEVRETRRVIEQAAKAAVAREELARRAQAARYALDTALIGTLHGFCHRALAEFGFSAGLGLQQPELVDDVRALKDEIVRDFWRRGSADDATAARLTAAWGTPDELARPVRDPRWRGRAASVPEPDIAAARADFESTRQRVLRWNTSDDQEFSTELVRCVGTPRTRAARGQTFAAIRAWAVDATAEDALATFDAKAAGTLRADSIEKLVPKDARPTGRVFEDIEALCGACAAVSQLEAAATGLPAARLLHEARQYLETELPRRLDERNLMSHDTAIDQLAAALESPRGGGLAARLGQRWKAALIDEFQDTDAAQWTIVRRLFGNTSLIVVGDPKQAVYGFRGGDVYAWRAASDWARQQAGNTATGVQLTRSYRASDGMSRAINALFSRPAADGAPGAFIEPIDHPDLESATPVCERALLRDGKAMAALQLWWLDPDAVGHAKDKLPSKAYVQGAVEPACVAWIGNMLADPAITLRGKHGETTRLQPQHIAVLVTSNAEAFSMQAALARAGIAATCNLQASVFKSEEADDLALLLAAAARPDDLRSSRAARASVLVGDSAGAIAATRDDDRAEGVLLGQVTSWATRLARHGPVAWLLPLLETAAPRLLALADGRRRVANYLQLIELLQGLQAQSFGTGDLAARFTRARVAAAETSDAERLRLDTDADAVTVATVHAAKGLEYDVVLLPYAVLGKQPSDNRIKVPLYWYHDDMGQPRVAIGKATGNAIVERAQREIAAEDIRKLYVAVTRAAALCVLPYGPTSATQYSALYHLLQVAGRTASVADCRAALEELQERAGDAAEIVDDLPRAARHPHAQKPKRTEELQARHFERNDLERDWQVWSFSRLVRGSPNDAEPDPAPGTGDGGEPQAAPVVGLAGPRFGTAVHAVFEATDFATWRDATAVPESERALIETSLRAQGLPDRGIRMDAAVEQVGGCIRGALNAALPCGVRLCDVADADRRAEIEFHFSLAPADTVKLYPLLHRFHYQEHRAGVAAARLAGLMTGRIDLTFRHGAQYHVIDWKTNLCAAYDAATLAAEIARHDYDLQWLVYTLALHRFLRQRLAGYDYERDVGDAYYLFVRGMAAGAGVYANRPPADLIEALDALFTGSAP